MTVNPPNRGEPLRAAWASELTATVNSLAPMGASGMLARQGFGGMGFAPLPQNQRRSTFELPLFSVREVKQDPDSEDETIGYEGWEIYMPDGCVTVGGSCTPINPHAYRLSDGTRVNEDGWYRLPAPSGTPAAGDAWQVTLHVKCNAALTGIDDFDEWPKRYVWAEIHRSDLTQQQREEAECDVGDTVSVQVGSVIWSEDSTGAIVSDFFHGVTTPVFFRDSSQVDPLALFTSFTVDDDDVTIEWDRIFVRNRTFSAAGATYTSDSMTELDKDVEAVYLKISTLTSPYTAMVKGYKNLTVGSSTLSVPTQIAQERHDGEIFIQLFGLTNGHVIFDNRAAVNNIQIYG